MHKSGLGIPPPPCSEPTMSAKGPIICCCSASDRLLWLGHPVPGHGQAEADARLQALLDTEAPRDADGKAGLLVSFRL